MQKVTIFSSCKPSTKAPFSAIHCNAIGSWSRLEPTPEIILFGNEKHEPGISELAERHGCRQVADVKRNRWGTPLVGPFMLTAQRIASNELLGFVNTDIILCQDFMEAIARIAVELRQFVMIGTKWNLEGEAPRMKFHKGWQERIRSLAKERGQSHYRTGTDYLMFTKGVYRGGFYKRLRDRPERHIHPDFPVEFPPLAWARLRTDTWLVWQALRREIPVVDATEVVFVIHQEHPHQAGVIGLERNTPEIRLNEKLAERRISGGGRVSNATWVLTKKGLVKKNAA